MRPSRMPRTTAGPVPVPRRAACQRSSNCSPPRSRSSPRPYRGKVAQQSDDVLARTVTVDGAAGNVIGFARHALHDAHHHMLDVIGNLARTRLGDPCRLTGGGQGPPTPEVALRASQHRLGLRTGHGLRGDRCRRRPHRFERRRRLGNSAIAGLRTRRSLERAAGVGVETRRVGGLIEPAPSRIVSGAVAGC